MTKINKAMAKVIYWKPKVVLRTILVLMTTLLLATYPMKEISTSPTFIALKVPLEVLHKCGYIPLYSRSVPGGPFFVKSSPPP